MSVEKKMRKGELRYIVKEKYKKLWCIYDKARGSYPYRMPGLGVIAQEHSDKTAAQAEADRLNEIAGITAPKTVQAKKNALAAPAPAPDPALETPELPDYGIMDEEQAAKYTEGIL